MAEKREYYLTLDEELDGASISLDVPGGVTWNDERRQLEPPDLIGGEWMYNWLLAGAANWGPRVRLSWEVRKRIRFEMLAHGVPMKTVERYTGFWMDIPVGPADYQANCQCGWVIPGTKRNWLVVYCLSLYQRLKQLNLENKDKFNPPVLEVDRISSSSGTTGYAYLKINARMDKDELDGLIEALLQAQKEVRMFNGEEPVEDALRPPATTTNQ